MFQRSFTINLSPKNSFTVVSISESDWTAVKDFNTNNDCYQHCGFTSGQCSFCEMFTKTQEAYCCRRNEIDDSDCPDEAILIAPTNRHSCLHKGIISLLTSRSSKDSVYF